MVDSSCIPHLPELWLPGAPTKRLPSFRKTTTTDSDAMAIDVSETAINDDFSNNSLEDPDNEISCVASLDPQEPNLVPQEPDRILESALYRIEGGGDDESFTDTSMRGSPSKSKTKPKPKDDKAKGSLDGPKPGQKAAKDRKKKDIPIPRPDRWRVVSPATHKDTADRRPSVHIPRIWASSRSELLAVLPELSRTVNGICESGAEMPILILEGEMWPEDSWDGGTLLEISMVRDFSGFESDFNLELPFPELSLRSGPLPAIPQNGSSPPPEKSAPYQQLSTNDGMSIFNFFTESGMINTAVSGPSRPLDGTSWDEEQATAHSESSTNPVILEKTDIPMTNPEHENVEIRSQSRFRTNVAPDETEHMARPYPLTAAVFGLPPTSTPPTAGYERHNPLPLHSDRLAIPRSQETELRASPPPNLSNPYSWWVESTSAHQHSDIPTAHFSRTHYSYEAHLSEQRHVCIPNASVIPGEHQGISNRHIDQYVNQDRDGPHTMAASDSGPEVHPSTPSREPWRPCVPQPIPSEIQVLVDGCHNETPVLVIISQNSSVMPFTLSPEYAYLYLGLFRVIEHSDSLVVPPSHPDANGLVNGRVLWRFKFRWEAGGEQLLPDPARTLTPWWSPDPQLTPDENKFLVSSSSKKVDFNRRYYSFLPLHLFATFGPGCSNEAFPRGWHCSNCGKLNEQILLRHRNCSHCKPNNDVGEGFAVRSQSVRDPHQVLLMSIPCNHHPNGLESFTVAWADSMRTFKYEISKSAIAKHIFTCNIERLQGEPSYLFEAIQLHVPLSRQTAGTTMTPGPYFTYLAPQAGVDTSASTWENEPLCVTQAREFLLHRGRWYGEIDTLAINRLTIMAWVTTGRKSQLITARDSTVTILCLGADVLLSIVPKSGFVAKDGHGVSDSIAIESTDLDATLPCDGSDMDISDDDIDIEKVQTAVTSHSNQPKAEGRTKVERQTKDVLSITLLHGDILILAGDDFECSVKRTGTSIFLIASE